MRLSRSAIALLLGGLLVRVAIAVWLYPGFDEAYYYVYWELDGNAGADWGELGGGNENRGRDRHDVRDDGLWKSRVFLFSCFSFLLFTFCSGEKEGTKAREKD